jgi:pyrroline-5-carboxylate reductase
MIGIIGSGNMGKAIALRVNQRIIISDVDRSRLHFARTRRIGIAEDNIVLVKCAGVIIIAVKPQDIIKVLEEIKPYSKSKLIISIAAGVRIALMERILGKVRVIRVMPNMPALVGKGISAITRGKFATKKDMDMAHRIFSSIGEVVELEEKFMDAVTALSGSGPAYYFLFTAMLERAGQAIGLKKELARRLARATFIGSAASASATNLSMQDFIKKVASKGGTTEAALKAFKQEGLEHILKKAVKAAANKSKQLAKLSTI